jgi:hypothetical protein
MNCRIIVLLFIVLFIAHRQLRTTAATAPNIKQLTNRKNNEYQASVSEGVDPEMT